MFDILYHLEYVVLLAFGFNSEVKDLTDQGRTEGEECNAVERDVSSAVYVLFR